MYKVCFLKLRFIWMCRLVWAFAINVWHHKGSPWPAQIISRSSLSESAAFIIQGPVVQSIVSLMSSLVVKMLTIQVSTISNSQIFLLENLSSFCKCKSYSHFFCKNNSVYAILNDHSFNDTLTNDIISFEQLGPVLEYHRSV